MDVCKINDEFEIRILRTAIMQNWIQIEVARGIYIYIGDLLSFPYLLVCGSS